MANSVAYLHLRKKWVRRHAGIQKKLWEHHSEVSEWLQQVSKQAVVGSLAGILMLAHPFASHLPLLASNTQSLVQTTFTKQDQLKAYYASILPKPVAPLTQDQEREISQRLSQEYHLTIAPELNGIRLNRSYGLIGAEQHLTRYPGDTMDTHFSTAQEAVYAGSGMAPGRGGWGYFAPSAGALTQKDIDREKYYIAVQTFLAPGWNEHVREYSNFFRYRKMIVVNPDNGKAIVADIADAGPAEFTGKHLGGSPEVMAYLERKDGAQKGPVIYLFIDDPNDEVPLGPISLPE